MKSAGQRPDRRARDVVGAEAEPAGAGGQRGLQAVGEVKEREDAADLLQPVGQVSTGMKMPEMKESTTTLKGPIAAAASGLGVKTVSAIPIAQKVAAPSST